MVLRVDGGRQRHAGVAARVVLRRSCERGRVHKRRRLFAVPCPLRHLHHPTLLRNYVEFDGKGNLLIVFGFQKATYPVSKIRRLRETSNPLASLAASFDRIELRIGYEELMIAVKDKEEFFAEIERRCPQVEIVRRASVSKSR